MSLKALIHPGGVVQIHSTLGFIDDAKPFLTDPLLIGAAGALAGALWEDGVCVVVLSLASENGGGQGVTGLSGVNVAF